MGVKKEIGEKVERWSEETRHGKQYFMDAHVLATCGQGYDEFSKMEMYIASVILGSQRL